MAPIFTVSEVTYRRKYTFFNSNNCYYFIKVNYNYRKKISKNLLTKFFKKLYNFENFIRRGLSDHKVTSAIEYLPMKHQR